MVFTRQLTTSCPSGKVVVKQPRKVWSLKERMSERGSVCSSKCVCLCKRKRVRARVHTCLCYVYRLGCVWHSHTHTAQSLTHSKSMWKASEIAQQLSHRVRVRMVLACTPAKIEDTERCRGWELRRGTFGRGATCSRYVWCFSWKSFIDRTSLGTTQPELDFCFIFLTKTDVLNRKTLQGYIMALAKLCRDPWTLRNQKFELMALVKVCRDPWPVWIWVESQFLKPASCVNAYEYHYI
jgi:hypothetical protein